MERWKVDGIFGRAGMPAYQVVQQRMSKGNQPIEAQDEEKNRYWGQQSPQKVGVRHEAKNKGMSSKYIRSRSLPYHTKTASRLYLLYPGRDWRVYSA